MKKILTIMSLIALFTSNIEEVEPPVDNSIVINLSDYTEEGNYILYQTDEYSIEIDVIYNPSISICSSGVGSWSGGYIPSSNITLYPHINISKEYCYYTLVGFYVDANGATPSITSAYGPRINIQTGTISNLNTVVERVNATSSTPAKAKMSWEASFLVIGSVFSGNEYLAVEINNYGQMRLSWNLWGY